MANNTEEPKKSKEWKEQMDGDKLKNPKYEENFKLNLRKLKMKLQTKTKTKKMLRKAGHRGRRR